MCDEQQPAPVGVAQTMENMKVKAATMAIFPASKVPHGTRLYTSPLPQDPWNYACTPEVGQRVLAVGTYVGEINGADDESELTMGYGVWTGNAVNIRADAYSAQITNILCWCPAPKIPLAAWSEAADRAVTKMIQKDQG